MQPWRCISNCRNSIRTICIFGICLGSYISKKADYADALSVFQHVYNINPNADHALHNLIAAYHHYARSLSDLEDYTTAIQLLEKALQLSPTDLNLRLSLANAYQGAENYERAATENIARFGTRTGESTGKRGAD